MRVCLVLVTWNRVNTLRETLHCIEKQNVRPVRVVIADNGSDDDTLKMLSDFKAFDVHVLELAGNLGFAYGLSRGMEYAIEKFDEIDMFLLMDDDSHPSPGFLGALLLARERVGKPGMICSIGLIDRFWKGPVVIFDDRDRERRLISYDPRIYNVDHLLVDGALLDVEVVKSVGTLRDDFFMMCEDVEYSKRIKKAGFSITVLEDSSIMERHHHGGGGKFSPSTLWRGYYHARNHLVIVKKYFSLKSVLSYLIRQTKYLVASLLARDRLQRIGLRLLGMYHGLTGKMGKRIDPKAFYEK